MYQNNWSTQLSVHAYTAPFMADWLNADHSEDQHWPDYEIALNIYLASQDSDRPLTARYASLVDSRERFQQLSALGDTHLATRLALVRIHADLGEPQASVDEINRALLDMPGLLDSPPQDIHPATDRPFLAPRSAYDTRPIESDLRQWLKMAMSDALESGNTAIGFQPNEASLTSEAGLQVGTKHTSEAPPVADDDDTWSALNSAELVEKANRLDSKNHEKRIALFLRAIGLDRNCTPAYLGYAKEQKEQKETLQSFLALKEARRLTRLPDEYQEMMDQLTVDQPDIQPYLERSGQVPIEKSSSPRKILVITNLFPPQEMGGFGRTMWEFCQVLIQRGHSLHILTADLPHLYRKPSKGTQDIERFVKRKLRLYGDWRDGKTVTDQNPESIRKKLAHNHQRILAEFKRFRPDACLVGNLDFIGYEFLDAILEQGIPVVHRLGNSLPGYPVEAAPKSPLYCLAGATEWLNMQLRGKGYSFSNMAVIYPASTLETYYRYYPPIFDSLRICFAGLLMPYKGAQILVQALAELQQRGIPFTCELAGDTTDPSFVEQLADVAQRAGFADRLRFTGFLSRLELAALYARSNVMVFPSMFDEPFGKSQIEAMAAGLAVITSGTGGAREIIMDGRNGWIFERGNAEDLADKLAFIYNNPQEASKFAVCGLEDAFRFNTSNSIKKLEQTYILLGSIEINYSAASHKNNNNHISCANSATKIYPKVSGLTRKRETYGSVREHKSLSSIIQPDPEISKLQLPVALVRSHLHNYSETFIEDHINFLSEKLTLIFGWPFPRFNANSQSVLSQPTENMIGDAIAAGRGFSNRHWNSYSQDLAIYLKQCNAKVVLLESGLMGAFFYRACEIAGLPYVVHFHGIDAFGKDILSQWLEHYTQFFRTASKLIVVSKAMREQLLRLGAPSDKIVLGPYGVSLNMPELAYPANAAPQFLAVGRFVEKKAPLHTLQAFSIAHKAVPDAQLVMVGDGPLLNPCKQWVIRNALSDAVIFTGARSRPVVSALMAESRAFVQHSMTASNGDSEGMPVAILEAGAHGLPVISTRHAGIPDAVLEGKHGFLVNEGDIHGMAEFMIRIGNEPELAGIMGVAYREQIAEHFSREKSISRLQNVLSSCAS